MANHSISLILAITILTLFVIEPVRGLGGGGGGEVGGRTKIEDVGTNKEVQELGKYSVKEYNRLQRQKGANGGDLKFRKVVEAEKQVVSGIKYYLKISATSLGGVEKTFDAEVVVQPWKKTKQLLNFEPSTPVTK